VKAEYQTKYCWYLGWLRTDTRSWF